MVHKQRKSKGPNKGEGCDGKKGKVHKAEVAYWMVGKEGPVLDRKRNWWWILVCCFAYKGMNFPFSWEFLADIGPLIVHYAVDFWLWTPRGWTPRFWHFYIEFLMRTFNFSIFWGRGFFTFDSLSSWDIFFLFLYFSPFFLCEEGSVGVSMLLIFFFASIGAFIFTSLLQLVLGFHFNAGAGLCTHTNIFSFGSNWHYAYTRHRFNYTS